MESLYQMGVCTWSPFTKIMGVCTWSPFTKIMGVCTWSTFTKWECVPLPNGSVYMESLYQMGVHIVTTKWESLYLMRVCTWSPFPKCNGSVHMESLSQMQWECAHGVPFPNAMGVCTWSPFTKWECAHGVPLPIESVYMESLYQNINGSVHMESQPQYGGHHIIHYYSA